jgi:large subunit ribosomal protein L17
MHRHGYIGRKLQLTAAPRRALVRGQLTSLVLHEAITTTEAKPKTVAPHFERLVTTAKKGTLASARDLRRELLTEPATQKLLQELLPAFKDRHGGYTRIIKLEPRRGDNAPMAQLSLVLDGAKLTSTKPAAPTKPKGKSAPAKAKAKTKSATATKAKTETKVKDEAPAKEAAK